MRLGIVLAATGAAVTALAVASAQDGFAPSYSSWGSRPTPQRQVHYLSRNGSSSRQTLPTTTRQPAATTAAARPAAGLGVRNYYSQLFADPAASGASASQIQTAGGSGLGGGTVSQAHYDRSRDQSPAGEIRQVASQRAEGGLAAPEEAGVGISAAAPADPFAAFERHGADTAPLQPATPRLEQSVGASRGSRAPAAGASGRPTITRPPIRMSQAAASKTSQAAQSRPRTETVTLTSGEEPLPTQPAPEEAEAGEGPVHRLAMAETGGPASVEVSWERIGEISVGRECRCELIVKNTGAGPADAVAVEAHFPSSVRLMDADPKPAEADDCLTWTIPSLPAGGEKRIAITLIPSQDGDLEVSALVRYTEAATTKLAVREPLLHVAISGPEQVTIGQTAPQTITISNPGTGTTDEVMVEVELPAGLEHGRGNRLAMPIGALAPKQSHVIPLTLFATQGGPQSIHVRATAGTTLHQEAGTTVLVAAPTLTVAMDGPSLRFVGRSAKYLVRVTNDGAAAADNVRVAHAVPKGFDFVSADKGGRFEAGPSQIVWYLGRVEAGQTVDLAAELTAASLGNHQHLVMVTGEGGAKAETALQTAIDGTASLVIEVLDLDDPVELGTETAYEVRVRNQGTKAATNVEVSCQVPPGVETIASRGPTAHRGEGNLIGFAPIGQLEPGTTALFRVVVRGSQAGKHRFRVRLTSDSIDEPLIHEELTHYYAD